MLLQDLRYALRTFARTPGFSLIALVTIAIGVGANAAIFSVVNAVLFRPLPFDESDRLVIVEEQNRTTRVRTGAASPANFLDWRERNHSFTGLSAVLTSPFTLAGDAPERIPAAFATTQFFEVLGASPALGRALRAEDHQPGAPRVVVLSDALWRRRFGHNPDAIGQIVRLNDEPYTIVGVMPPGIDYPEHTRLWVPPHWPVPDDPLMPNADPSSQRGHTYFSVIGRLKPGVNLERAQADLDGIAAGLERAYPTQNQNVGAAVVGLRGDLVGDMRPTLLLLFAAVGVLLLIAAANVSGLLIARATARHQEMAIRLALGASRRRIVRQLLTESALLAMAGGLCGVGVAAWLVDPLVAMSPRELGVAGAVRVDRTVLLFGLAISTGAGLLFGLAPARQSLRTNLHDDLKQSARGAIGASHRRLRAVLVVSEMALSLMLLVAAGLTIKSLVKLQHVPTGFDSDHAVVVPVSLPNARYKSPPQKADFWERALGALREIPGVEAAGAVSRLRYPAGTAAARSPSTVRPSRVPAPTIERRRPTTSGRSAFHFCAGAHWKTATARIT